LSEFSGRANVFLSRFVGRGTSAGQSVVSLYRLKAAATAISMRLHRVRRDDEKHYTDQFDSRDAMS